MKVLFVHRKRDPAHFSIEGLFEEVRRRLPDGFSSSVHVSPHWSKGLMPRFRNGLAVRRERADVYHVTGDVHYLALFLPKRKTLLTIHDLAFLERAKGLKRFLLWLFWAKLPVMRSRLVTTVSEETRREVIRRTRCRPEKVVVVPDFVHERFKPSAQPKPFDADCPTLLHVGTKWNKNLERLAEALNGVRCRLRVVGRLSESQKAALQANGVAHESGHGLSDEEMLEAYRSADLLAFVSLAEGFGLPILEAQACGTPVLTSNRSSMPEVGGEGALYADPEDAADMRSKVLKLIADESLRAYLVDNGFANVRRYSPQAVAEGYAAVYRRFAR